MRNVYKHVYKINLFNVHLTRSKSAVYILHIYMHACFITCSQKKMHFLLFFFFFYFPLKENKQFKLILNVATFDFRWIFIVDFHFKFSLR